MKKTTKFALGLMFTMAFAGLTACEGENDDPVIDPIPAESVTYTGTTMTYPVSDPDNFYESDKATYAVVYDEVTKTAVLNITDADFLQGMPQLGVMTFPGINWRYDSKDKVMKLQKDDLIPEIAERPFPNFPISDLVAVEDPGKALGVNFICEYRGIPMQVTFSGTPKK